MRRNHQSDSSAIWSDSCWLNLAGRPLAPFRGRAGAANVGIGVARARVRLGVCAQHGVDVGRPILGGHGVDLRAGHPEPGPAQHAGSGDPPSDWPAMRSTVPELFLRFSCGPVHKCRIGCG